MRQAGHSVAQIAAALGVAPTTIGYHIRLAAGRSAKTPTAPSLNERPVDAQERAPTRERVRALLGSGRSRAEVATTLGVSKSVVTYHARRLGETIDARCARRYDWKAVQEHYDRGHSVRDCIRVFGFSSASWFEAAKRGDLRPRPSATPLQDLLVAGTPRGRYQLKVRLVREGPGN